MRDWLYVEDHCAAIQLVLERGIPGETYNIGALNEQTNIAIVDQLCALLDEMAPRSDKKSYSTLKTFVSDRPGHDRRYSINCAKIQREFGWIPRETFGSSLRKTLEWYLKNRHWCSRITDGKYRRQRLGLAF